MPNEHIVRSFDEELNRLDTVIAVMGGMAEAQLAAAIEALLKRNGPDAEKVVAGDARIDECEEQVNDQVKRLLALRQPMAEDLRAVMAALKISSDLERIGDLAKNIAKRTVVLTQSPPIGSTAGIGRMGRLVQEMIKDVLDAYISRNATRARDVLRRDEEVDSLHTSLFRELLTYMMEDPRNISPCTHLLFVAKNVERIGDHATNIAEAVVYMVEGRAPQQERPKGDTSAFTSVDESGAATVNGAEELE